MGLSLSSSGSKGVLSFIPSLAHRSSQAQPAVPLDFYSPGKAIRLLIKFPCWKWSQRKTNRKSSRVDLSLSGSEEAESEAGDSIADCSPPLSLSALWEFPADYSPACPTRLAQRKLQQEGMLSRVSACLQQTDRRRGFKDGKGHGRGADTWAQGSTGRLSSRTASH